MRRTEQNVTVIIDSYQTAQMMSQCMVNTISSVEFKTENTPICLFIKNQYNQLKQDHKRDPSL